jgi:hypothetical protein
VHIAQFLLARIGVNVLAVVSFAEDHRWNERTKHITNELYGAEFYVLLTVHPGMTLGK